MSNSDYEDFYFGISDNKIYICFFENEKNYFKQSINFEIPDSLNNNLNFKIISNLLKNNIRRFEKSLGIFLTKGNISIKSKTYQSILFSTKNTFDEKKLDEKVVSNLVKIGTQYFVNHEKSLSIIHIIINKYIIDGKNYNNMPSNIKFKKIILEIEVICLDKDLINKVSNLFKECKIQINKIVSFEYAKNFLYDDDKTMCISAKKVLSGVNKSEIKIQEIDQSKSIIFDRIFNFFD
tara:strand:- start:11380 stop:12087 length:708 start_codon:yes stop_codon:yes gene_type:complete